MVSNKKWFHVSDILSAFIGKTMSETSKMTCPDGSIREQYNTVAEGYLKLSEYISSRNLRHGAYSPGRYNKALYNTVAGGVYRSLRMQVKWLKDLKFDPKDFSGTDELTQMRIAAFVKNVAQEYGEWHAIEQDNPTLYLPARIGKQTSSNNTSFLSQYSPN